MTKHSVREAYRKRDLDAITQALDAGGNPDEVDEYGRSVLMNAVIDREYDVVEEILHRGSIVSLADKRGWTALHFAAQNSDVRAINLLANSGAVIDAQDVDGNTPLSNATFESRGRGDAIIALLSLGADPDAKNNHGQTPRGLASIISNFDVARFFGERH